MTARKSEKRRRAGKAATKTLALNLRASRRERRLIDQAAALAGKSRTEFMLESARRAAQDLLLDQRLFRLDRNRYRRFLAQIDAPPRPSPRLRALMRRRPAR
jgi:uncharacterized protein (DUF1778 family)